MREIIECVPNVSEGRNPQIIEKLANTIKAIEGVKLIHQTSDTDHNRTVYTFIGEPESVIKAAFELIKVASNLIDMDLHTGVHPCMGATDVCPLIPLQNINYQQCNKYALKLAERVSKDLKIPVFLYEKSAKSKEKENLANIRKGGYQTIKKEIKKRKPDFGPLKVGTAGTTAIGVRKILIAYNINLNSRDLKIAKKIACQIREKDGGFKNLKALGLELKDRDIVQVSMNLTDYKVTPPLTVFKKVQELAHKYHTEILESELIGLIPRDALTDEDIKTLKFKGFSKERFLDYHY